MARRNGAFRSGPVIEHVDAGGIYDEDLQPVSRCCCLPNEFVDVLITKAVADHHEPSVWDRQEALKLRSVPLQQHAAVDASELIAAHDQKRVIGLSTLPEAARSMQLEVRLEVAGELEIGRVIGNAQIKELALLRVEERRAGKQHAVPALRVCRRVALLDKGVLIEREDRVEVAEQLGGRVTAADLRARCPLKAAVHQVEHPAKSSHELLGVAVALGFALEPSKGTLEAGSLLVALPEQVLDAVVERAPKEVLKRLVGQPAAPIP